MDKNEKTPKLYVTMFGGFALHYNGDLLTGDSLEKSQFALLLQEVLFHRKKGVDRQGLLKALFGEREMEDAGHSLRNTIYMAKKRLREMGLPEADYIYKKKNFYFWTEEIEAVLDSEEFEQGVFRALQLTDIDACIQELSEAIRLYTGSFLPHMQSVDWAREEDIRLRDIFRSAVWQLDLRTTRQKRYDVLYQAALHAEEADPYANWEALEIKALIGMDRFDEAEKRIAESEEMYTEKFGKSSPKAREYMQYLGRYMMYRTEGLDAIQERLHFQGEEVLGGYFIPLPMFRDLYRSLERVMMRTHGIIFLMLCSLVDEAGNALRNPDEEAGISESLQNAIVRAVRHTDTVARYSKNQYLVLLYGTNEENCSVIRDRILRNFREEGYDADLSFEVNTVVP